MSLAALLGVAVALAIDAFAVAVATGVNLGTVSRRQLFRLSFHFGLFQALMPLLGWWAGDTMAQHFAAWDHWLAFALLLFIGGNMLLTALRPQEAASTSGDATRGFSLVALSVATSVDALAVGLSLSLLGVSIVFPALVIGVVAAAFTAFGMQLGRRAAQFRLVERWAGAVGGLLLWGIGVRILIDHGVFS